MQVARDPSPGRGSTGGARSPSPQRLPDDLQRLKDMPPTRLSTDVGLFSGSQTVAANALSAAPPSGRQPPSRALLSTLHEAGEPFANSLLRLAGGCCHVTCAWRHAFVWMCCRGLHSR